MSERPSVRLTHTVAMVDVDAVQVNFSVYFRWMDEGFIALFKQLGHPLSEILGAGLGTPAVDATCNYLRPVGLDDVVEATSKIGAVGRSSFVVEHRFEHGGEQIAQGSLKHVWIRQGTPAGAAPLPDWLRAAGLPVEPAPS
jgi:YbgC/YbaW family acyl-CoA thioester hydrolase